MVTKLKPTDDWLLSPSTRISKAGNRRNLPETAVSGKKTQEKPAMSTRCNVLVFDDWTDPERPILLYRHSDGYPEGVKDSLDTLLGWVNEGKVRTTADQAAGWLFILGAQEYGCLTTGKEMPGRTVRGDGTPSGGISGWKVGCYEPAVEMPGDIEYAHFVYLTDNGSRWFSKSAPSYGFGEDESGKLRAWAATHIRKARGEEEPRVVEAVEAVTQSLADAYPELVAEALEAGKAAAAEYLREQLTQVQ